MQTGPSPQTPTHMLVTICVLTTSYSRDCNRAPAQVALPLLRLYTSRCVISHDGGAEPVRKSTFAHTKISISNFIDLSRSQTLQRLAERPARPSLLIDTLPALPSAMIPISHPPYRSAYRYCAWNANAPQYRTFSVRLAQIAISTLAVSGNRAGIRTERPDELSIVSAFHRRDPRD
jgi:hypothetical protein